MVTSMGHITDSCGAQKEPAALQALQSGGCINRHEETIAFMARYYTHETSYFVILEGEGRSQRKYKKSSFW